MSIHIYLASASPRRHELLNQISVQHTVIDIPAAPGEDEPRHIGENPLEYVQRTAREKAERAQSWLMKQAPSVMDLSLPILTADTTVALGDLVLGKPADNEDAARILNMLSDQVHLVHTAIVLTHQNKRWFALSTSKVSFGPMTKDDIHDYIQTGEPFGKAGAYGIQGYAAKHINNLHGSFSGVMGLPLYETAQLLKKL